VLGRDASCPGSTVSSYLRHLFRHLGRTSSSRANSPTSSQVSVRPTALRCNFREYRFLFTVVPFPETVPHFCVSVQGFTPFCDEPSTKHTATIVPPLKSYSGNWNARRSPNVVESPGSRALRAVPEVFARLLWDSVSTLALAILSSNGIRSQQKRRRLRRRAQSTLQCAHTPLPAVESAAVIGQVKF